MLNDLAGVVIVKPSWEGSESFYSGTFIKLLCKLDRWQSRQRLRAM